MSNFTVYSDHAPLHVKLMIKSVSSMNVEHFSKILTDIMCPYFEVRRKKTMRSGSLRRGAHSRGTVIDKPWFTPELKNKFTTYRIALSIFNRIKN